MSFKSSPGLYDVPMNPSVSLVALDGGQILLEGPLVDVWLTFVAVISDWIIIKKEGQDCRCTLQLSSTALPTPAVCPWWSGGTSWQRFVPEPSCSCWWRWRRRGALSWKKSKNYSTMKRIQSIIEGFILKISGFVINWVGNIFFGLGRTQTHRSPAWSLTGRVPASSGSAGSLTKDVIRMDVSLWPNLETHHQPSLTNTIHFYF